MSLLPIWKRYRALAAGVRIEILLTLNSHKDLCVKDVALQLDIAEDSASKHLQLLASAGWVARRAAGRYLYYTLDHANILLDDVLTFAEEKGIEQLIFKITALTHERRIWIVRALAREPMRFDSLCRTTRIPSMALRRHLDKLERRCILRVENKWWTLVVPDEGLGKRLIESVVGDITPAQV